ncbi:hypothetical protein [Cyanothece sp. BG0011]|uniref:hypothetical protein n=1 Tax=Cyanothece sp. BG0011 TaxID=2082950 RepID=UPI0018E57213|nr:hypothetical protein [Cyanothece sp. BG0011]
MPLVSWVGIALSLICLVGLDGDKGEACTTEKLAKQTRVEQAKTGRDLNNVEIFIFFSKAEGDNNFLQDSTKSQKKLDYNLFVVLTISCR